MEDLRRKRQNPKGRKRDVPAQTTPGVQPTVKYAIRTNGHGLPVVALDIDGHLGDYHGHFLRFAENWIGKPMPDPSEINPGLKLYKFMGVSLRTYRECKLAYRQGGLKRWMPAYPGAAEVTRLIQTAGAEVWICTTRPYLRLDNIDPDTREWLSRNRIRYNAVLFGDDKYKELKRQAGDRVCAISDDLPELLSSAWRIGFSNLYMRDQPYNQGSYIRFQRFSDLDELWGRLKRDIDEWKGKA